MMGASNPHPHCQIWSNRSVPNEVAKELRSQFDRMARRLPAVRLREARARVGRARGGGERRVRHRRAVLGRVAIRDDGHRQAPLTGDGRSSTDPERDALAEILQRTTARYDRVFSAPFPYSMGFHQRPTDGAAHDEFPLPRALLSATVAVRDCPKIPGRVRDARRAAAGHHSGGGGRALAAGLVYSVSTFSKKTPWNCPGFSPDGRLQFQRCSTSAASDDTSA